VLGLVAQSCYPAAEQPGIEPATSRSLVRRPTTKLPSHTNVKQVNWYFIVCSILSKTVSSKLICLRVTMWFIAARKASGEYDAEIEYTLGLSIPPIPQVQVWPIFSLV